MKTQVESKITKKKEFTRTGRRKKLANVKIVQSKDGEEKKEKMNRSVEKCGNH